MPKKTLTETKDKATSADKAVKDEPKAADSASKESAPSKKTPSAPISAE